MTPNLVEMARSSCLSFESTFETYSWWFWWVPLPKSGQTVDIFNEMFRVDSAKKMRNWPTNAYFWEYQSVNMKKRHYSIKGIDQRHFLLVKTRSKWAKIGIDIWKTNMKRGKYSPTLIFMTSHFKSFQDVNPNSWICETRTEGVFTQLRDSNDFVLVKW